MPIIVETTVDPGSAVLLTEHFWNDAADPIDFVAMAYAGESYDLTPTIGGGIEGGYASGRRRGWSTLEESVSGQVTYHRVSAVERAWFAAHRGRTVCFRDHLGNKVFVQFRALPGSFSTLPVGHAAAGNTLAVAFESVTWSESV